ncbi:MAG: protein translocase subunit SecD [Terriglobales bacterium]
MHRNLRWKTIFIIVVVVACILGITGIPKGISGRAIERSTIARIHLGLDLQGGTHLILQVHVQDAVNAQTDAAMSQLQDALSKAGIPATVSKPGGKQHPETILVQGVPPARAGDLSNIVQNDLGSDYQLNQQAGGNYEVVMQPLAAQALESRALQQEIETISNRINQLGVTEPTVQQHGLGANQILVQLPGISDPARVKQVMQESGQLSIHLVQAGPFSDQATALSQYGGVLPANSMLMQGSNVGGQGGGAEWYLLGRTGVVNGTELRDAEPELSSGGQMEVDFTLTRAAGQRFRAFTGANVGKQLAVVLNDRVAEAAVIEGAIGSQGRITGNFTAQSAHDLALILRSGALPASFTYLEEEVVGPSLGADSIHDGVVAAIIGFLVVAIAMLIYYRGAGINAVLALVLNLVILMAYMAWVSATLTLPGIAGIILTIGMAVDANVLIFERIREELRHGKSVPAAVDIGFRQAFITILDTHVTTIVSAVILFLFGTGPIKGFAITLTVGLLANLFTAVFVSRVIFDYVLQKMPRGAELSV